MKIWAILLSLVMMLSGCDADSEIERGMALRSLLLQSEKCTLDAHVMADYGEYSFSFKTKCSMDKNGIVRFEIIEPDSICGICGQVSANQGEILFGDTAVYFPLLSQAQISPVTGPWMVLNTLKSGYLRAACREGDQVRLTMDDLFFEQTYQIDIWLDTDNIPVYSEILSNGSRILVV